MYKFGITGTRFGVTDHQLKSAQYYLATYKNVEDQFRESQNQEKQDFYVLHGDCIGADAEMHDLGVKLGYYTEVFPPHNSESRAFKEGDIIHPTAGFLERDRFIVDTCDHLLAFPAKDKETYRSGTWYTIRYALEQKVGLDIIWPDGTIFGEDAILENRADIFLPGKWGA